MQGKTLEAQRGLLYVASLVSNPCLTVPRQGQESGAGYGWPPVPLPGI